MSTQKFKVGDRVYVTHGHSVNADVDHGYGTVLCVNDEDGNVKVRTDDDNDYWWYPARNVRHARPPYVNAI